MRTRPPRVLDPQEQKRLIAALERLPEKEGFVGYRTRAFVYLLWDGALRTGAAIWLDIEEVVKNDPKTRRIHVLQEPLMRPCEGNKYRERRFVMSDRARAAIADYLRQARDGGWLAQDRLRGPLWISSRAAGQQQRTSRRTAMQSWKTFLENEPTLSSDYQLDDIVLTGRIAFATAANASPELISEHAGIGTKAAAKYSDHLPSRPGSPRDVMSQLNQKQKRSG